MSLPPEKEIANQFNLLIEKCFEIIRDNISAKKVSREVYICSLYIRAIQYSKGITTLTEKNNFVSIVPLFRSSLEALVDLSNLCNHDDYVDYLTLLTLRKKRQRFSNWHKNKSNPFFPNVDEIPSEYRKIVKQNNRDLKELKIRDFSFIKSGEELSIKRKFKLAGLEYVYESIYDLNSSDAHNDLSSLTSKHLLEKDNAELVISSENKDGLDSIKPHIITLSGLLINALEEVFIFFNKKNFNQFNEILIEENQKLKELVN